MVYEEEVKELIIRYLILDWWKAIRKDGHIGLIKDDFKDFLGSNDHTHTSE